jgi:hypothetical protein
MEPNVVESREGWQLCIVPDGVMVGILLGKGIKFGSSIQQYSDYEEDRESQWMTLKMEGILTSEGGSFIICTRG